MSSNKNNGKGEEEKKPDKGDNNDSKPGAVAVSGSSQKASSNNNNNNNTNFDDNLNMNLRERREQQKRNQATAAGAGASNVVGAAATSAGGLTFKDQAREVLPPQQQPTAEAMSRPAVGASAVTKTANQQFERKHASSNWQNEEAKEMEHCDDAKIDAVMTGAVASSAKQCEKGPNFKDQVNNDPQSKRLAAGAVAGAAKQCQKGPNFKDQVNRVPQSNRSYAAKIGVAAADGAGAGAMAGSAKQQVGHPFFKDQVRNVSQEGMASAPVTTDILGEQANYASSQSVIDASDGSDGSDVFRPPEADNEQPGSSHLIQAELVADPRSVMNVAVELEQELPRMKTNLIIMFVILLVIGGVIGSVLGSQSSSSPEVPPLTACDNATLLELDDMVNVTTIGVNATISTDIPACGNGAAVPEAKGVWFFYETGTQIEDTERMIITTCATGDLRINVFLGDCDGLLCTLFSPYSNTGAGHLACDDVADSVRFSPQAQSKYLILVQSDVGDDIGDFSILARREISGPPSNDECENATPLTNGLIKVDSSSFATVGDNLSEVLCGTAQQSGSPDVWYSVTSTSSNNTVLRVTTCSGNTRLDTSILTTQVVVYSGNCNNLECIGGDSGSIYIEGVCNAKGEVIWLAEVGVTYYVRIQGLFEADTGTFGVKVETVDPPPNDICQGAILLEPGNVTASSTVAASVDPGSSCSSSDPVNSTGVWFQVLGNDEQYTVSTCSGDEYLDFYGFQRQVSVYSGSSCSDLTCLDFNNGTVGEFGIVSCNTGVSWFANSSEDYWVRVFGTNSTGPFPIAVYPTPENDMCESAILLELNQTVEGTTLGGRLGPKQSNCTAGVSPAYPRDDLPGAWYMVNGTGNWLTLSACTGNSTLDETGYNPQIVIYSGDCNSLLCVVGNDGYTGGTECYGSKAGVSWFSSAGDLYFAKVYGSYSSVGTFGLALFEGAFIGVGPQFPPPVNNLCENAILLFSGSYVSGTTEGATNSSNVSICGDGVVETFSPDVWYLFIGTGGVHTATTCTGSPTHDYTGFDSQVIVYSGECGNLTCITGNDDNSANTCSLLNAAVSWITEEGVSYYIRIMDFSGEYSGASGLFGLRIDDGDTVGAISVPENNQCQNATMLEQEQTVDGTTLGATETSDLSSQVCGDTGVALKPNPDVWYSFVGTGTNATVSTCGTDPNNFFDSQLAVYTGDCGTGLICVIGTNLYDYDDWCSTYSITISWQAELGVTYWIRVFGQYGIAGDFAIMVYEGIPVFRDMVF